MRAAHIVAIGLLTLSACSAPPDDSTPDPVALVKTAVVARQSVGETVKLYGVADSGPGGRVSLVAPIEARLVAILVPSGSAVSVGQAVIRLAPGPTAALDLAKARSDADAATRAYARAQRLRTDGLASDADVEAARAATASAQATLTSLTGRSLILRAGQAGHIENITAAPGDIIAAGTTIATISGMGPVRARFGIDPALARTLKVGTALQIGHGGSNAPVSGHIAAIDPNVDPQTRLASAYADVPAAAGIRAGEPLTAQTQAAGTGQSIVIPYAALLDDGGQPYVFVIAKGVASRRDIVTGSSTGATVAVMKALKPGDTVVVEGGTALEDGMKVRLK